MQAKTTSASTAVAHSDSFREQSFPARREDELLNLLIEKLGDRNSLPTKLAEALPKDEIPAILGAAANSLVWLTGALRYHEKGNFGGRDIALAGAHAHSGKFPAIISKLAKNDELNPTDARPLELLKIAGEEISASLNRMHGRAKDFVAARTHINSAIMSLAQAFGIDGNSTMTNPAASEQALVATSQQ